MKRILLTALVIGVNAAAAPAGEPAPRYVRMILLDTSKSMVGERIEVVRDEVLENARQLPPSAEYPILVVPFHSRVDRVLRFQDEAGLRNYLRALAPDGGTSIASGLRRAVEELDAIKAVPHVCVLLYTDGEDPDQKAIEVEEERLDRLFADRDRRGLKQSVVFAKRWQSANANLLALLRKGGHARVIDSGELRLIPLTLTPHFQLTHVARAKDDAQSLEVRVAARIDVDGKGSRGGLEPLRVQCLTADARGDLVVQLPPGAADPTSLALRIPLDPRAATSGRADLHFRIAEPREATGKEGMYFPILPIEEVHLPVPVPALSFRCQLTATLEQRGKSKWADAAAGRVAVPLLLTLDVQQSPSGSWKRPIQFRVTAAAPGRLGAGQGAVTISGPGTLRVPLDVEAVQAPAAAPGQRTLQGVELVVAAEESSAEVVFEPSRLDVRCPFAAPPITTRVSAGTLAAGSTRWADVTRGVVRFTAKAEVRVDGPLSSPCGLTVDGPPEVLRVAVKPEQLQPGTQTITLELLARLGTGPISQTLLLRPVPQPRSGTVELHGQQEWRLVVATPPRPRLALADGGSVPGGFDVLRLPGADAALRVTPVLVGLDPTVAGERATALVSCSPSLRVGDGERRMELNCPTLLRLAPAADVARPWLCDTVLEGELSVLPGEATSAAVGSRQRVVLRIASFRTTHQLQLVMGATLVTVVGLLAWLWVRLRSTRPADDGEVKP